MVRDPAAAPIAGARVYGGALSSKSGPTFSVLSGSDGRYRGELPTGGGYEIAAQRAGFEEQRTTISLASDVILDFTLQPGIVIGGTVVEAGVGPLENATVEIVAGSGAGQRITTGPLIAGGRYSFSHVLPGDLTIRAGKAGYESVERPVHADDSIFSVDFTLKWAYGACLRSVTPVLFDRYPSAGGHERVFIDVVVAPNPDQQQRTGTLTVGEIVWTVTQR